MKRRRCYSIQNFKCLIIYHTKFISQESPRYQQNCASDDGRKTMRFEFQAILSRQIDLLKNIKNELAEDIVNDQSSVAV